MPDNITITPGMKRIRSVDELRNEGQYLIAYKNRWFLVDGFEGDQCYSLYLGNVGFNECRLVYECPTPDDLIAQQAAR